MHAYTLVCAHIHALTATLHCFPGQTHCMCLMGQYMWCVMWLTASPLPRCPAFKPSSSSGCLSPGVDCIFYLSFSLPGFIFPSFKKIKNSGVKIAISITCPPPAVYSPVILHSLWACGMRLTAHADSGTHTQRERDACTISLCVYQAHTHTLTHFSISLKQTEAHAWPQ